MSALLDFRIVRCSQGLNIHCTAPRHHPWACSSTEVTWLTLHSDIPANLVQMNLQHEYNTLEATFGVVTLGGIIAREIESSRLLVEVKLENLGKPDKTPQSIDIEVDHRLTTSN